MFDEQIHLQTKSPIEETVMDLNEDEHSFRLEPTMAHNTGYEDLADLWQTERKMKSAIAAVLWWLVELCIQSAFIKEMKEC